MSRAEPYKEEELANMMTKFKIQKASYKEMLFDADFAFASICGNGQIDAKIIDVWIHSYILIQWSIKGS